MKCMTADLAGNHPRVMERAELSNVAHKQPSWEQNPTSVAQLSSLTMQCQSIYNALSPDTREWRNGNERWADPSTSITTYTRTW